MTTSDQLIGSSRAVSKKAGSVLKVTAVTIPSAPRPTRAASNRSGCGSSAEQVTTLPSASTSSSAAICAAMLPLALPVPCVPVCVAPATVCTWMSPMLVSDRPRACRAAFSVDSGQPASTVISPAAASMDRTAVSPAGLSITPSVLAAGVKECPLPVILIASPSAAAFVTSAATSAAEAGTRTLAGLAVTFPAQFRQVDVLSVVIAARPLLGQVQPVAPNSAGRLS